MRFTKLNGAPSGAFSFIYLFFVEKLHVQHFIVYLNNKQTNKNNVMKTEIKSTKLRAGRYQVTINGSQPFIVQERLNNDCVPTGEWNMFAPDGEWMDTRHSKKVCLYLLEEMHKAGRLNEYRVS